MSLHDEKTRIFGVYQDHIKRYTANHLTLNENLDQLQEECGELIVALSHLRRYGCIAIEEVREEMAHVLISCAVLSELGLINQDDIDFQVEKKDYLFDINLKGDK